MADLQLRKPIKEQETKSGNYHSDRPQSQFFGYIVSIPVMLESVCEAKTTMSLIIDLPNELEQRLEAEAKRQGLSTETLARNMLEEKLKSEDQNGASAQPRILAKNLPIKGRASEVEWLQKHRDEYAGQWIALDGEKLIASGDDLKQVVSTARRLGVPDALMMRVEPNDALPFAGF